MVSARSRSPDPMQTTYEGARERMSDWQHGDYKQLIEEATSFTATIDPAWKFDEHEIEVWHQFQQGISDLAEAISRTEAGEAKHDDYNGLIDTAYRHAKELDEEWFITGTEQEGNVLYGDQERWGQLAHYVWDLIEILLVKRGDDLEHSPHAFTHGS